MHAKELIQKFGGQTELAKQLGVGQSAIAYWAKTGKVPTKWHEKLLSLANRNGVDISAVDLLGVDLKHPKGDASLPSPQVDAASDIEDSNPIFFNDGGRDFLFYESDTGAIKVHVILGDETVWATQQGIADIFDTSKQNISYHLSNIFNEKELHYQSTVKEILTVRKEGDRDVERSIEYYNLDAIISVGYRISSYKATQFRRWATSVLKEYLIKGFVLDDERLKQGGQLFGKDYFDELLERIREIRASERRFYQKITDIYSQCSIDYDRNSPVSQMFYAHVQDKLHYAIHGHTAAELIQQRVDASKPNMGLTCWKNEGKGGKILKGDVTVGKNYLSEDEISDLNRLVGMFLDFAENFARRHIAMTMKDWAEKLDDFLGFNAYEVLQDYGKVRRDAANQAAIREYEKFRVRQDQEYESDFDKIVDKIKSKNALSKKK